MAQNTFDFSANPNGKELMDDYLAKMHENNLTSNSGNVRPSYVKQGTIWLDTTSKPYKLKLFNGTEDVVISSGSNIGDYQTVGNLSQTLDASVSKYPSNKAVKNAVDGLLPVQTGNTGKFLKTDGSVLTWENAGGGGVAIGTIFSAPFTDSWTPKGAVPANGAEYARDRFPQFFDDWLGKPAIVKKNLYAWEDTDPDHEGVLYSLSENPQRGEDLYWEDGQMDPNQKVSNVYISPTNVTDSYIETSWNYMFCNRNPALDVTIEENSTITGGRVTTVTYEQFANEIATNGFCDSYAVNGNSFKVPQIPDGLTLGVEALAKVRGNGRSLGLTDGNRNFGTAEGGGGNAFMVSLNSLDVQLPRNGSTNDIPDGTVIGVVQDADKSGMVAEPKAKNATKQKWFCQLSGSEINKSDMDWAHWQADLQGKANKDLSNVTANIDVVIESKVNSDGTWYRKYKSGWLEQGGITNQRDVTITFPKPFKDETYTIVGNSLFDSVKGDYELGLINKTSTSIRIYLDPAGTVGAYGCNWYACGQGA